MSAAESQILRRRAEAFLRHAKASLESGEYDFSCFSSEQAVQLHIKSAMLRLTGEVPRSHRVREILHLLGVTVPEAEGSISPFLRENSDRLRALDDAYIASRYLPSPYTREEAEALLRLSEEIIKLVEEVLDRCRR